MKPQLNLAFEEYLVSQADKDSNIMFLWQNDQTVVIGRNQNPWSECHVQNIKRDHIHMIRRLTGGGAVFQDLGNLNFTFISQNTNSKVELNFKIVIDALSKWDIHAVFTGKNDLVVENKKVSGNAFVVDRDILCHHGTLLISTDLNRLTNYLSVSDLKLKSKGIESIVSRVVNLKDICDDINVDEVMLALMNTFSKAQDNNTHVDFEVYDEERIAHTLTNFSNRYESWQWNYGSSPNFDVTFEERFHWGEFQINFNVDDAIIREVKVYSDANDSKLAKQIEDKMLNRRFDKIEILQGLNEIQYVFKKDIIHFIDSKLF